MVLAHNRGRQDVVVVQVCGTPGHSWQRGVHNMMTLAIPVDHLACSGHRVGDTYKWSTRFYAPG